MAGQYEYHLDFGVSLALQIKKKKNKNKMVSCITWSVAALCAIRLQRSLVVSHRQARARDFSGESKKSSPARRSQIAAFSDRSNLALSTD